MREGVVAVEVHRVVDRHADHRRAEGQGQSVHAAEDREAGGGPREEARGDHRQDEQDEPERAEEQEQERHEPERRADRDTADVVLDRALGAHGEAMGAAEEELSPEGQELGALAGGAVVQVDVADLGLLSPGDEIELTLPQLPTKEILPEDIPLNI